MQDIFGHVCTRKRPQLLVEAARIRSQGYRRDRHLAKALKAGPLPGHGEAILRLLNVEASLDERRIAGQPSYALTRHIEVLAALIAETRLLRQARADQPKASGSDALMRVI